MIAKSTRAAARFDDGVGWVQQKGVDVDRAMRDKMERPADQSGDGRPDEEAPDLVVVDAKVAGPAGDDPQTDGDGDDVHQAIPMDGDRAQAEQHRIEIDDEIRKAEMLKACQAGHVHGALSSWHTLTRCAKHGATPPAQRAVARTSVLRGVPRQLSTGNGVARQRLVALKKTRTAGIMVAPGRRVNQQGRVPGPAKAYLP